MIVEDSTVGIRSGVASGMKVIGLTAGKHWYKDRSEKELIDAGALSTVKSYKNLMNLINSL